MAQRLSRLILTGFMGAGKSTVGEILARDLGWRFVDLDRVIEGTQPTYGGGDIPRTRRSRVPAGESRTRFSN